MTSPTFTDGLGLNLLAEAIGILVTVFLVDALIKGREQARWNRAHRIVSFRLSALSHSLIYNILRAVARTQREAELGHRTRVPLTIRNIGTFITSEGKHLAKFDLGILQRFKDMLTDVLPICSIGAEPEVIENALMLDRALEIPLYYKDYDLNDPMSRAEFAAQLRSIAVYAAHIARRTLLHGATRKLAWATVASTQFAALSDNNGLDLDGMDQLLVADEDKGLYSLEGPND